MNGKNRCRILKDIRKKIAEENGIEYVTTECKYKGDCPGTCPKCESEVKYLEQELERKRGLGKKIAIGGIAAGITIAATGCTPDTFSGFDTIQGDMELQGAPTNECSVNDNSIPNESGVSEIVDGEMVEIIGEMPEYSDDEPTPGDLPVPELPEISDPCNEIMGDMVCFYADINKVVKMTDKEAFEAFKGWNRGHIDYAWQEHIISRVLSCTTFCADDGTLVEVYFDEDGTVLDARIVLVEAELMGEMPA